MKKITSLGMQSRTVCMKIKIPVIVENGSMCPVILRGMPGGLNTIFFDSHDAPVPIPKVNEYEKRNG